MDGDAILKGLHILAMLFLVFIPLKVSLRGCSDLTGDNLVPVESGICAEKVCIKQEETFSSHGLGLLGLLLFLKASLRLAFRSSFEGWSGSLASFLCLGPIVFIFALASWKFLASSTASDSASMALS